MLPFYTSTRNYTVTKSQKHRGFSRHKKNGEPCLRFTYIDGSIISKKSLFSTTLLWRFQERLMRETHSMCVVLDRKYFLDGADLDGKNTLLYAHFCANVYWWIIMQRAKFSAFITLITIPSYRLEYMWFRLWISDLLYIWFWEMFLYEF